MSEWQIPNDLDEHGQRAAETIVSFLTAHDALATGGAGQVLYSPQQWADRGEYPPGDSAILIVTHDGGAHAGAFNYAYEQYDFREGLQNELAKHDLYCEQGSSWYSIIYPQLH